MNPRVNILIPTYNHAAFVAKTIESCLAQQTNFDFDLVIGDDGSTDQTARIVQSYADQYPAQIRAFLHPTNLGPQTPRELGGKNNVLFLFEQCQAPYIALCEGDDYWTDPHKLQKQVELLDTQANVALSFHNVEVQYEDGSPSHLFNGPLPEYDTIESLFQDNWFVPTCSTLFRNVFRNGFPDWFKRMAGGDLGIFILAAAHGKLHYSPEVGGVYRRHRGGMSNLHTPKSRFYVENRVQLYQELDAFFDFHYSDTLQKTVQKYEQMLAEIAP
ncbi:MAG: glycosyltransferase [Cytophagia bacterium]|nr:MAG: glycosyltransferase [Cytophagales bacterium]TAG37864.1 MAG: glycosyltransferase [Cytophagia bacterium]TAG79126.1 MAG: glycosyltransferase [Cytophagales bacterium]